MYSPELTFAPSNRKAAARALPRYRMLPASKQPTRHDSLGMSPFVWRDTGCAKCFRVPAACFAFGYNKTGRAASTKREEREDIASNWHGIMRMPAIYATGLKDYSVRA